MKIKPDSLRIIDGELHAEPIAEPIPEPVLVELGPDDVTPETDAIRFSSNPREYYDLAKRLERERNELRAEVARLKAACEKEFASVLVLDRENTRLKSDKARLEKALARIGCYFAGTDSDHVSKKIEAVLMGNSIDEAIDAAMK